MFFKNFKTWITNRRGRADVCFVASFPKEVRPTSFVDKIKNVLSESIELYYVQLDEENRVSLSNYEGANSNNIRIHSINKIPIENIFIRTDDLKSVKHTMISVGLPNSDSFNYEALEILLLSENLFLGCFEEIDYLFWQNCTGLSAYKYRGGLKYTKNSLGEKIVDISDRPGRYVFTKYFRYAGSSKMWFGPQIYNQWFVEKSAGPIKKILAQL
jgi:hypothetical protein